MFKILKMALYDDIVLEIFSYLKFALFEPRGVDFARMICVNKQWNKIGMYIKNKKYKEFVHDKKFVHNFRMFPSTLNLIFLDISNRIITRYHLINFYLFTINLSSIFHYLL